MSVDTCLTKRKVSSVVRRKKARSTEDRSSSGAQFGQLYSESRHYISFDSRVSRRSAALDASAAFLAIHNTHCHLPSPTPSGQTIPDSCRLSRSLAHSVSHACSLSATSLIPALEAHLDASAPTFHGQHRSIIYYLALSIYTSPWPSNPTRKTMRLPRVLTTRPLRNDYAGLPRE